MKAHVAAVILLGAAACGDEGSAPKGRVITLSAPTNEDDARRAGCFSSGASAGAGFGRVIESIGGLEQYFELRDGHIQSVMIAEAHPYDGPRSTFSLRLLPGEDLGDGKIGLDESVYHQHNIHAETPSEFPEVEISDDYWVDLYADRFHFPKLSALDPYLPELVLEGVTFTGKLYVDDNGLTVDAVFSGYLTGERATPQLLEETGGFDAKYEPGRPALCSPPDCNALSVCLQIETQPVEL